ncbi:uncharacterized protein B0H18DRAFT_1030651 [Fomitopsis serialis]|uniref:uncharacterized protein n=1 Tax=Fomitopsis serialis TaxID=139415 RepID=UPI002007B9C5|nr:uncharacterized protein B0H18DRAFT_1030651 [Neoantrodia serialis]KAH9918600.1 hypothetical protein B0H18DRAFT_1030651 [Neoantrodia serialis]
MREFLLPCVALRGANESPARAPGTTDDRTCMPETACNVLRVNCLACCDPPDGDPSNVWATQMHGDAVETTLLFIRLPLPPDYPCVVSVHCSTGYVGLCTETVALVGSCSESSATGDRSLYVRPAATMIPRPQSL